MVAENNNEKIELKKIANDLLSLKLFIKQKLLILCISTLIFGLLGIIYSLIIKTEYTSELTFAIEKETNSSLGAYANIAAQFGVDIGGASGAFEGDNLIELMKSNNIIRKTLLEKEANSNKLMIEIYLETSGLKDKLLKNDKNKNFNFNQDLSVPHRLEDSILNIVYLKILKKQLNIDRIDKKLNYVQISMKDKNENFAKKFVELLTNNAIEFYTDYKSRKAKENLILITQKADSVKNILYGSMFKINESTDNQLLNLVKQIPKFDNQKNQANIQAHTALYGELLKQLGLAQIAAQKETPLIQIIDRPIFPLPNNKISKIIIVTIFSIVGFLITFIYLLIIKRLKLILS